MDSPYIELTRTIGQQVLINHGLMQPETWPARCTQYAEPYIADKNLFLLKECFVYTGSNVFKNREVDAYISIAPLLEITEENKLTILECLATDALEAANDYLRAKLEVKEFQLLDLDNSDMAQHKGTWTGKSYIGHACFLNRSDVDCEWNEHDQVKKDEKLSFYQATEAFKTLEQYLTPYKALHTERNVIVVGLGENEEIIYYTEAGIWERLRYLAPTPEQRGE